LLQAIGTHLTLSTGPAGSPAVSPPFASQINLNTASPLEIEKLPLIGPSRAAAIVSWRERHGSFKNLNDLVLVPGVSQRMADAIRHLVAF
jgi:competence protein ComEA